MPPAPDAGACQSTPACKTHTLKQQLPAHLGGSVQQPATRTTETHSVLAASVCLAAASSLQSHSPLAGGPGSSPVIRGLPQVAIQSPLDHLLGKPKRMQDSPSHCAPVRLRARTWQQRTTEQHSSVWTHTDLASPASSFPPLLKPCISYTRAVPGHAGLESASVIKAGSPRWHYVNSSERLADAYYFPVRDNGQSTCTLSHQRQTKQGLVQESGTAAHAGWDPCSTRQRTFEHQENKGNTCWLHGSQVGLDAGSVLPPLSRSRPQQCVVWHRLKAEAASIWLQPCQGTRTAGTRALPSQGRRLPVSAEQESGRGLTSA